MAAPRVERRLTAVLAVDIVGYSRLMERDEPGTHERVQVHRKAKRRGHTARFDRGTPRAGSIWRLPAMMRNGKESWREGKAPTPP